MTAELCWSRVIAGALMFSKEAPDILWGLGRCLERIGVLPEKLVWDREGAIAGGGRPTTSSPDSGVTGVGWIISEAADPQAKGILERSHRFMRSNFVPGRRFANPIDFQDQLDRWCENGDVPCHPGSARHRRDLRQEGGYDEHHKQRGAGNGRQPRWAEQKRQHDKSRDRVLEENVAVPDQDEMGGADEQKERRRRTSSAVRRWLADK